MSEAVLKRAIANAGGPTKVGIALGISASAVSQWDECPVLRVLALEALSGVPRHELRPDVYPPVRSGEVVMEGAAA